MIRSLIGIVVVAVALSLFASAAAAQSGASVSGAVKDQNAAVIANAKVQLLNMGSGQIQSVETDPSGTYLFSSVSLGSYQLSAGGAGFANASRSIAVRRNTSYREDFVLVPGVIESNLTVTAGKGNVRVAVETPQIVTVTESSRIEEQRPAATLRVVEQTPNLTAVIANAALERPRLRGLASNRLLIILDGERLNNVRSDPTSGVSPSIVDATQLASMEVLSGAGSSLYGSDAMGGVINLITSEPARNPQTHYLGVRLNADLHGNGPYRRGAATINWNHSRFALRLSGSLFRGGNYHSGDQAIEQEEVVRLGNLATDMGNAVGNSIARTYAVWNLPAGAEIPNGQAHGFNDQIDLRWFPAGNHSIRYRQLNSQHQNLGFSFISPPFDQRTQFNSFRRLDKHGLRYEGHELAGWLPRAALGFYRQKYSFPDDTITSPIVLGSSWTLVSNPGTPLAVLTGNRSAFGAASLSDNKNSITTYALDMQATLAPWFGALLTTGVGYLRDSSADEFSRIDLTPPFKGISGRASTPNSVYRNWSWFNLFEYEPQRRFRFVGGLRVDNWRTEARATSGFPLGVESRLLDASFTQLQANPGAINIPGAAGVIDLVKAGKGITTVRTVVTGYAGLVVHVAPGINPYFRWGNSFREPGITERYLLRDFGDPTFSVLVVPNTALRPERGHEYDAGIKFQRSRWNASIGYFVNDLRDFIGSAFASALFVPADPAHGLDPISPFFPFHGVLYVQRTNTSRARIQGLEGSYELSLSLGDGGRLGLLTPFGTIGVLKGSNLTPDQNTLKLIAQFYNRADTPVPLSGSATDAPLSSITPLRMIHGVRFDSPRRRWFGEYGLRYQARVRRADPLDLSAAVSTEYGTFASLNSFASQLLRAGYVFNREKHRVSLTLAVENLTNRLYFEHFQTAPAPGRSVVVGTTIEFFNLLKKP